MMIFWRIIKKVLSKIKKLIKEEQTSGKDCEESPFRYPLLVSRFRKILSQVDKPRSSYAWGVLCGADLAKKLGITKISVIEFGVAGGSGLMSLERIASEVEELYGITIDVFGFDTGAGLPKPKDYRDLPHLWNESDYAMDKEKLQNRLRKSKLILGPVKDTISDFIRSKPHPIAFMSFDVDLYSSTMEAFKLLEGNESLFLPRVDCYFDDISGFSFGDFNGERLAITDFNKSHELRKIDKVYGLRYFVNVDQSWTEKMYLFHIFDHSLYARNDGMVQTDTLPLKD